MIAEYLTSEQNYTLILDFATDVQTILDLLSLRATGVKMAVNKYGEQRTIEIILNAFITGLKDDGILREDWIPRRPITSIKES